MREKRGVLRGFCVPAWVLIATTAALAIAPSIAGAFVYWTDATSDSIGRAALDGTVKDPTFITGAQDPRGVAVNGNHIYWTNSANNTIGRANIDGTGVNQNFISGLPDP